MPIAFAVFLLCVGRCFQHAGLGRVSPSRLMLRVLGITACRLTSHRVWGGVHIFLVSLQERLILSLCLLLPMVVLTGAYVGTGVCK